MRKEDVVIGTKLTVRDDLKVGEPYDKVKFVQGMKRWLGKTVTITRKRYGGMFEIEEEGVHWIWSWEMFKESQWETNKLKIRKEEEGVAEAHEMRKL